jgi:hypothetical protein
MGAMGHFAVRSKDLDNDRFGSIAPHRYPRAARGMSASPPIASVIWHHSEVTRRAIMYGPAVRYKMDFQDNERESCINVSGL